MNGLDRMPRFGGVYLTFDDGPDPTWTPQCLEALARANARATFFLIGAAARRERGLTREIAAAGHAIGNHTMTHAHPWTLSTRNAIAEVRDGAYAIEDVVGVRPTLFRPPHGARRRCMIQEAQGQGEALVMWDVSAVDWGMLGRARGIARRLSRAQPRDIVLMHDGANVHNRPDQLLQVLPGFLRSLLSESP